MALPTADSLKNFTHAFQGQPFISVPAKTFTLTNMEYAWQAQPFVSAYAAAGADITITLAAVMAANSAETTPATAIQAVIPSAMTSTGNVQTPALSLSSLYQLLSTMNASSSLVTPTVELSKLIQLLQAMLASSGINTPLVIKVSIPLRYGQTIPSETPITPPTRGRYG